MRHAAIVRLALTDPQGFFANITFDSVASNRPEPNCGRKPAGVCVPEARSLGGGDLQVLPQLQASRKGSDAGGRTLRITYTATVRETGMSCSGVADVCAIPNKRAPACAAFGYTRLVRTVLGCPALG